MLAFVHGSVFSSPFISQETQAFPFGAAQPHSLIPNLSFLPRESFPDLRCCEVGDRRLILGRCKGFK
jgi:hypothetical protein